MDALIVLLVYVSPFVAIGIAAKRWIARRDVALSDVRAEAGQRRRSRFVLGIWRHEDPE
jgi:hypothetical protein